MKTINQNSALDNTKGADYSLPMPHTIHPRVMPFQKARADINDAVTEAIARHRDLTYLELLQILNEISASWLKYGIRDERHPNEPDKPGGFA